MGTPDLYPRIIIAETPLVRALETIVREAARAGEPRDDFPARLVARALAALTDLAPVQYWASEGAEPMIEQIPDLGARLASIWDYTRGRNGYPTAGHDA